MDALCDRALALAGEDKLDDALDALDEALKLEPQHRRSLQLLIVVLQDMASPLWREQRWIEGAPLLLRSGEVARRLKAVAVEPTEAERGALVAAFYNEACALSRLGETDKALDALELALKEGFLNTATPTGPSPRELFLADPDLDPLRSTARFEQLKASYLAVSAPSPALGASPSPESAPEGSGERHP